MIRNTWQGSWNYQTRAFKTTMNNMLKALMDKPHSLQEQMGNVSREKKTKIESKRNARDQNTAKEMNMSTMGVLLDWIWLRKEHQQNT